MRHQEKERAVDGDYKVMTLSRLKRATQNAMEHGLERWLEPDITEMMSPEAICLAQATESIRHSPRRHCRVMVLVQLDGSGELGEMSLDMMPEDWDALPTVAEFDAELDLFEAAVRGTR